jgi:hypothetical protein
LRELAPFIWELAIVFPRYKKLQQTIPRACTHPVKTKSGHIFGLCCLYPWIQRNGAETTCPYCRIKLAGAKKLSEWGWQRYRGYGPTNVSERSMEGGFD